MLPSSQERYRQGLFSIALFAGLWIPLLARADGVNFTAMTFCATNDQGALNVVCRQNTYYLDGAWDIAIYEGTIPPPPSVPWLNNPTDLGISINLLPGEERTFVFCFNNFAPGYFGMNLFFDGLQNQSASPQVSVFAHTDDDGPSVGDPPAFAVTPASVNTMGWPVFPEVPGSASVTYINESARTLVELTDFVIYSPDSLGLDLVQPQEPGGLILTAATDGVPDVVGQFTLSVRTFLLPPSNLVCTRSQDGKTVDLSWTNDGIYDAIKVMRDGAEVTSLGGAATSYQDLNVPPFTHTYQVLASIEGVFRGPSCRVIDPANPETVLSAVTLFGTNSGGTVRIAERWNTLYIDPAWDLAFHEGPLLDDPLLFDPADTTFWINDREDMSINISLLEGETRTFSFYNPRAGEGPNLFGVNLFFDGGEEPSPGAPGISVFAPTDEDGPDIGDPPLFEPNAAKNTMGWPIASVQGANSLVYENCAAGLKVTLTSFVTYYQNALNGGVGIDFVQAQEPGGLRSIDGQDGLLDFAGEFTLQVEALDCYPPPSNLVCNRSEDGKTVDLSWQLGSAYDSLKILRDGALLASVAPTSTSYQDTNVPAGSRTYEVIAEAGGRSGGPSCKVTDPANPEAFLTAMTFCATNEQGALNAVCRQNTFYLDDAWDIAVYEGTIPPDSPVPWINKPDDLGVSVSLLAGDERTFVFCVSNVALGFYGLNLFFDGLESQTLPQISVFAHTDDDGPGDPPAFAVIPSSVNTMGWPVYPEVPGAASFKYINESAGIQVDLTDFVVYSPDSLGLDLVQPQVPGDVVLTAGLDGLPDLVGEFTLSVKVLELRKTFHRGDADQNNALELTDAIQILGYLFLGSTTRVPECEDAADADDNGSIELTDAIRVLGYLFLGTGVIPDPGATESPCGPDPTTDGDPLECLGYDQLNCAAP